ncbi:hypothetical protein EMA8858_00228 [Emticicia aquatica]|jgi:hypothetical protein|uniref:Uncharacterized protein n=1 Tax=Emticicia aquatica TaxID=1681835 RepID=A0ABM9ALK1_9BACT|nr:hypothetical protein [Emticicia aquatica]CAH0994121.1 hypothetical protein EMA8858_00228 [Emticicia aquatica]
MKKTIFFFLLGIFALNLTVLAQTAATPAPIAVDTVALKELVGKYKVKDAPIEELIITIANGKLMGEAVGQGSAELAPTPQIDIFEVVGYGGTVEFVRNETKAVVKVKLTIQGSTMEGEKQL